MNKVYLLTFALLFSACSQYGGGTTGTGLNFREGMRSSSTVENEAIVTRSSVVTTVDGKVVDEKGRLLKGLEVMIESVSDAQSVILDARGQFHVVLSLPATGVVSVSVPAKGDDSSVDYVLPCPVPETILLRLQLGKEGSLKILDGILEPAK